jgi:hypothetical protein
MLPFLTECFVGVVVIIILLKIVDYFISNYDDKEH